MDYHYIKQLMHKFETLDRLPVKFYERDEEASWPEGFFYRDERKNDDFKMFRAGYESANKD